MMANDQLDLGFTKMDDIGLFGLWLDTKAELMCSIPQLQGNVWWLASALHRKKDAIRAENDKEREVFERCARNCMDEVHDYPQSLDRTIQVARRLLEITEEMQRRA